MTAKHSFKRYVIIFILAVFIAAYVAFALTRPLPPLAVTIKQPKISAAMTPYFPWPNYGEAAFGAVGYGLLAAHNAQTAVPMASTAKVITALAVLQKKPLAVGEQGPVITITDADVAIYQRYVAVNGSVVLVTAGEQISEYQALQAMLLPSANNIADSLGIWAYGSTTAFLAAANALAASDGATSTHIVDASGFDPGSVSTASDLVKLGLAAMNIPVLAQVVNEPTANIPVEGEIHNVNSLLGTSGIAGIKTGNTDQAGGVFLTAANTSVSGKPLVVVSAIMSAPDLGTALHDSVPVINAASSAFEVVNIATDGEQFGTVTAPWGESTNVTAMSAVQVTRWRGTALSPSIKLVPLHTQLTANTTRATLSVGSNGKTYATTIVSSHALPKPSLFWRLRHSL
jgi:D-alanyl-D-alanine carboxypeptidase (penicillin-binding protein 5/6)